MSNMPLHVLMGSLPFFGRGVGKRKFKKLEIALGTKGLHNIYEANRSTIINVDGFEFSEDGVFAPVESASGAQRSFIGVAVRIALSQSLGIGMDTIILDEPTSEMREENAMRLAGSLLSQDQVLFITHRQDDQVAGATIIEL